ncbi:Uncharacterised protein [Bordetella pertussis]|nr:Uncharacterised protein [Bordetella pertussis]
MRGVGKQRAYRQRQGRQCSRYRARPVKCHDVSKPCLAVWDCCNRRIWSGRKKSR